MKPMNLPTSILTSISEDRVTVDKLFNLLDAMKNNSDDTVRKKVEMLEQPRTTGNSTKESIFAVPRDRRMFDVTEHQMMRELHPGSRYYHIPTKELGALSRITVYGSFMVQTNMHRLRQHEIQGVKQLHLEGAYQLVELGMPVNSAIVELIPHGDSFIINNWWAGLPALSYSEGMELAINGEPHFLTEVYMG